MVMLLMRQIFRKSNISLHTTKTFVRIMSTESTESLSSLKRKCDLQATDKNECKRAKIEDISDAPTVEGTNKRSRKSRKVALLLCYLGKNYYGMQRNHGVVTVEEELLKALLKADLILPEELETPKSMKFQRAARTDKGVSAIRQVVSLKIPLNEITDAFPSKVNQYLPPEIKVLCVKRVTQSFDCKIACDARTYSYMLPTFAFSDSQDPSIAEEYRIRDERLQEVNEFLKVYQGTHNFYNFTSGRLPNDASCMRYIMSCECGKPFLKEGLEFVVIRIKGQSFMLHQIRKMIGLTIAIIRKLVVASEVLQKVWKSSRVDIPMAPGLGLMLEELHYDWYNKRYGNDGIHESLTWGEFQEMLDKFRDEKIYGDIATTERNEKSMLQWLQTLPYHTFDIRISEPNVSLKDRNIESCETSTGDTELNTVNENNLDRLSSSSVSNNVDKDEKT